MLIVDLQVENEKHVQQAAELLLHCFDHSWETVESAVEEVMESFEEGKITRVVLDEHNNVIGWVGGVGQYDGNVWEMHPLAVHPGWQRKGIGRLLVEDFEEQVRQRGGLTVLLGTDDEDNQTTLGGIGIYPAFHENVKEIKNKKQHPFEFYQKLGYMIVGVIPDANGFGKPDLLMAKRVGVAIVNMVDDVFKLDTEEMNGSFKNGINENMKIGK